MKSSKVTKRQILKISAKEFDPNGYFSPVILRAKLVMKILWKEKKDWDEEVSEVIQVRWNSVEYDLQKLSSLKLDRFIGNGECVLLCFCDASTQAYAACIYVRCKNFWRNKNELGVFQIQIGSRKNYNLTSIRVVSRSYWRENSNLC